MRHSEAAHAELHRQAGTPPCVPQPTNTDTLAQQASPGSVRTRVQRPCFKMSRHGITLDCLAVKGAAMLASPGRTMLLA